jgi:hypothetical protein
LYGNVVTSEVIAVGQDFGEELCERTPDDNRDRISLPLIG